MTENQQGSRDLLSSAAEAPANAAAPMSGSDRPAPAQRPAPIAIAPRIARLLAEEY